MKTKIFFAVKLLAAAAVLVGAVAGVWKLYAKYTRAAVGGEQELSSPSRGDIELLFQDTGAIISRDYRDVKSTTDGKIIGLYVQEGQHVREGDKLLTVRGGRSEAESYTPVTISAPMTGLVVKCPSESSRSGAPFVQAGDVVSSSYGSNATCIMRIVNMSRLGVDLEINESDVVKIKQGAAVTVGLDALPGLELPGRVTMVAPQAEEASGYGRGKIFRVTLTLDKIDPRLRLGMTARVKAVMERRANVLKLPLSAVFFEGPKAFGYRQAAAGAKPEKVPLSLGLRSELDVEISSGAVEGDKFLTEKPQP